MSTTDSVICLRKSDYSETSQVVHFLSRASGVVRVIAKGSKRAKSKSGGAIDVFSEGRCVYAAGRADSLGTLMEFTESVSHLALRADLGRLNVALYMLELCGAMVGQGDPHAEVFDLLHSALARLGQPDATPSAVLAYFQWRLARHAGVLGDLTTCVACGQAAGGTGVYYCGSAGGLLCRNCEPAAVDKEGVASQALSGIAILAAAEAGKRPHMPPEQADAVNCLLAYHIQYQLGRRLKTARHAIGT